MTEKEFNSYWTENRERILQANADYVQAKDSFKMKSGADWLLWAIPVVVGILILENFTLLGELLRWVVSALATVVAFVVCVWVKSVTQGSRSPEEVEADIRRTLHDRMVDAPKSHDNE